MKKLILICGVLLITSCAKERRCRCNYSSTYAYDNNGTLTVVKQDRIVDILYSKSTKRYVKQQCSDRHEVSIGYTQSYTGCKIID